jgi:hypothetical protein
MSDKTTYTITSGDSRQMSELNDGSVHLTVMSPEFRYKYQFIEYE